MPLPEPLARGFRRAGWLAGLPALALIWAGTMHLAAPGIAARIEAEAAGVIDSTATATGEPWLRLEARGRDLFAAGEASDVGERETVLSQLAALESPRRIVSEVGLVETASPFVWSATRAGADRVVLEGSRPVEVGRRALEVQVTGSLPSGTSLDDGARAARGAPPDFPGAAAFLAARLAGLADGGRVSLSDTVLSFSGEALNVPAYDALRDALANPPAGYGLGRVEILPPAVSDYRFSVEKVAGGVVLDGFAPSGATHRAARSAAAEAALGGFVDDRLREARGLPEGIDPKALLGFVFKLSDLIQAGRVAFADGAVSVIGDAIDGQATAEAAGLMRAGRPAGVGAGRVSLAAKPLSPYRVSIRRTGEGVALTGHLPDIAARERVLAALRPRLYRETLTDRTRLAEGAPADLAAALAATAPILATLAAGEVAVSDRTVRLTGESLYREAAAQVPERLAATLPPGWVGSAAVAQRDAPERRGTEACRETFSAATAAADLRFPAGSIALAPGFYPTLDALAALAKACPSLRIAVSGPADPAGAKAPAGGEGGPALETPKAEAAKKPEPKAAKAAAKPEPGKPEPAKPEASKKGEPAKKADTPEEPPADLPRQRALALVEYLLQAGARPDQVAAGPDGPSGRVAFALAP